MVRNLIEDDANMQERFTIPRGALKFSQCEPAHTCLRTADE
jgi:hypothetical protein